MECPFRRGETALDPVDKVATRASPMRPATGHGLRSTCNLAQRRTSTSENKFRRFPWHIDGNDTPDAPYVGLTPVERRPRLSARWSGNPLEAGITAGKHTLQEFGPCFARGRKVRSFAVDR